MKETKLRSLLKSISWRVIATIITTTIAFVLTGEIEMALEIGGLDMTLKLIIYFFHERIWGKIAVGREAHPLEDINISKKLDNRDKEIIREKLRELGYIDG